MFRFTQLSEGLWKVAGPIVLFSKILSNWTLFDSKSVYFPEVLWFSQIQAVKNHQKSQYFWYSYVPMQNYWILGYSRKFFIPNMATNSYNQIIFCIFWMNNVHLLKILLNNPKNCIKQEVLRIFFTPKNTPPKDKNSKMS